MKKSRQETISLTNCELTVTVVRSKNRKHTVSLGIEPSGQVVITAPVSVPFETIVEIVRSKSDWLNKQIKEKQQLRDCHFDKEFVSGESMQFLGKQYMLKIIQDDEDSPISCFIQGKHLKILVPKGLNPTIKSELIKEQLISWYKQQAAEKIPERVAKYAEKYGFVYNSVLIREQEKRWGSCDHHGNLRFNWKILMAPISLLDYVVAHELCHLKIKNHTPKFWQLLETIMPDYQKRKTILKSLGSSFTL